ncbi:MAG: DUF1638 domain-containing protein [bacterium]|nr:DUF1638 domain-containing protein [bacterium]
MNDIYGISCGIFKKEVEELIQEKKIEITFSFIDSMLHLNPLLLEKKLNSSIKYHSAKGHVLLFGECHSNMDKFDSKYNIEKVKGLNCCEIILGHNKYHELRKEGAFILLPEWIHFFKKIFIDKFGFNSRNIKEFMNEMHSKLIYLDTGLTNIPRKQLEDISELSNLKMDIKKIDLNILTKNINNAVYKLRDRLNAQQNH